MQLLNFLPVQLLSTTTANAIKRLFPEGEADGLKHFKELADFIQLADRNVIKSANIIFEMNIY